MRRLSSIFNRLFRTPEELGQMLMQNSVWHDYDRDCRHLVEDGADLSVLNSTGDNALMASLVFNRDPLFEKNEFFEYLIDKKRAAFDLDDKNDDGDTALHIAINNRLKDAIPRLLEAGASPDIPDSNGRTPLFKAIKENDADLVNQLICAKADFNGRTPEGATYLMQAAALENNPMIVGALLKAGADVKATDLANRRTALHHALLGAEDSFGIALLLEAKADVNAEDVDGNTPLPFAKSAHMVETFLEHGAQIQHVNKQGQRADEVCTPLATYRGRSGTHQILSQAYPPLRQAYNGWVAAKEQADYNAVAAKCTAGLPLEKEIILDTPRLVFRKTSRPQGMS